MRKLSPSLPSVPLAGLHHPHQPGQTQPQPVPDQEGANRVSGRAAIGPSLDASHTTGLWDVRDSPFMYALNSCLFTTICQQFWALEIQW